MSILDAPVVSSGMQLLGYDHDTGMSGLRVQRNATVWNPLLIAIAIASLPLSPCPLADRDIGCVGIAGIFQE